VCIETEEKNVIRQFKKKQKYRLKKVSDI